MRDTVDGINERAWERAMTKLSDYEVIVGNVGTIYSGTDGKEAVSRYLAYVVISKESTGRASGEPVTLMCNGEPIREYAGTNPTE